MTTSRRRFGSEFKNELCREVVSTSRPVGEVAEAYDLGPEKSPNWLVQ
jgi:transposase